MNIKRRWCVVISTREYISLFYAYNVKKGSMSRALHSIYLKSSTSHLPLTHSNNSNLTQQLLGSWFFLNFFFYRKELVSVKFLFHVGWCTKKSVSEIECEVKGYVKAQVTSFWILKSLEKYEIPLSEKG